MNSRFILCLLISIAWSVIACTQVNLQTGSAQFSLPLYAYQDPVNRIGTSISLLYTSGNGLKVSELPSSVGSGWSLSCGGFIQRIVRGEPDDQMNTDIPYYVYPTSINSATEASQFQAWVNYYFPNGYLYSEYSPADPVTNGAAYTPLFESANFLYRSHPKFQADLEQDMFMFNINGRTGYFVIGKVAGSPENSTIRTLMDSKLKIEIVQGDYNNNSNIRTTYSAFQITDENGIKYIFSEGELSQVCIYNKKEWYKNDGGFNPGYGFTIDPGPPVAIPYYEVMRGNTKNAFTKNKWHLSKIINPVTNTEISFQYEDFNLDLQGHKTSMKRISNNKTSFGVSVERLAGICKRLKKIILSPEETVEFIYSSAMRLDIPTDRCLDEVQITYKNEIRFRWKLGYGYFVKNQVRKPSYNFTSEDKVWTRLCLLNIQKVGNGISEPPHKFTYYLGNEDGMNSAVPPLFSFYQDVWGYYNPLRYSGFYDPVTQTSSLNNPPYEPFDGKLLPKAIFEKPLQATEIFARQFKAPTFEARNGILKSITNPFGGTFSFTYEPNHFDINSFLGAGGVRVSKVTSHDGIDQAKDNIKEYKYNLESGGTSAWGFEIPLFQRNTSVRISKNNCSSNLNAGINYVNMATSFVKNFNANAIATFATGDRLSLAIDQTLASALSNWMWYKIFNELILGATAYQIYSAVEYSSNAINSHNFLPFQYSRVEIVDRLGAGNIGKTVFEFTSPADQAPGFNIDHPVLEDPYSSKQRYAYWLYGLPRKVTIYDHLNRLLQKTENNYKAIKYTLEDEKYLSQKWSPRRRSYHCSFVPTNEFDFPEVYTDNYYPICGRVELMNTNEYKYNPDNPSDFATMETSFGYSATNFLQNRVTAKNSKGETLESNIYHSSDYTLGGAIQIMKDRNMLQVPIATQSFLIKNDGQKVLVSGNVSEFGTILNGEIKSLRTYGFKNDFPVPSVSVAFNPGQLIPNTTLYKDEGSMVYDIHGNLTEVISETGKMASIFDYNNRLQIATVSNASPNQVAYSSFESDGLGGWEKQSNSTILNNGGVTGIKSFSGVLRKTQLPQGDYTITLWSIANGIVTVNGQNGTALITIGNWRLYEWKLSNVTTVEIYANNIDEVRLHPLNARMTTVIFDQGLNKIASNDAANYISHFEYDGLGRLKLQRDEHRHVRKAYEYNYKQ